MVESSSINGLARAAEAADELFSAHAPHDKRHTKAGNKKKLLTVNKLSTCYQVAFFTNKIEVVTDFSINKFHRPC